jgi:ABC-type phosphate/phosphonate transport system substrate-binding protein
MKWTHGTVLVFLFAAGQPAWAAEPPAPRVVRVGVADSMFGDLPRPGIRASLTLLQSLILVQTGLHSEFVNVADGEELADKLAAKELDLAVFQGFEYAWVCARQPDVKPLVLAVKHSKHLHAHLLVRKDAAARSPQDLRGQVLAMAAFTRPHCKMYLNKACAGPDFFKAVARADSAEEALDDLVDGLVGCALVDEAAYASYRQRKPARFDRLRELGRSECFPAALIAYRAGTLDEHQVKKFREGMVAASSTVHGRQLLTMWRTRGFEHLPDDFDRNLADIAKAYPRPQPVRDLLGKPAAPAAVETRNVSAP